MLIFYIKSYILTLVAMSAPRSWFLGSSAWILFFSCHFPIKGTRALEKCLIQGLEQEMCTMSLEHLTVSESTVVLKKQDKHARKGGGMSGTPGARPKGLSVANVGTI